MRQLQPSHDLNESTEPALWNRQTRFRAFHSWPGIRGHGYAWIRARRHTDDNLQFVLVGLGPPMFDELFLVEFPEGEGGLAGLAKM